MITELLVATWVAMCGAMVRTDPRLWAVVASSIAFATVRVAVVPVVAGHIKAFSTFGTAKQRLWCNTAVSMLHSVVSSLLACSALVVGHSLGGDFVSQTSSLEFASTAISTGYFAYDLWDYVLNRLYVKSPGIVLHHVVILICYIAALVKTVGVPLLSFALVCELHSAFMHLRKLMSMSGYSLQLSSTYRLVWRLQWIAFAVARAIPHPMVLILTYQGRQLFVQQTHFWMAFSGIIFINLLNAQLFFDVLRVFRNESAAKTV